MNTRDRSALRQIKMLAMDVDGVMTDGRTFFDGHGGEGMFFSVQDGSGIKWLHRVGIRTALITGRDTDALRHRITVLKIPYVFTGIKVKILAYNELKEQAGLGDSDIAYAGDDLHDMPVMRRVGFAFAVNNARDEVKECAHYVTQASGGFGAVREIVELLLKEQGKWDEVTERYFMDEDR